VKRVTLSDTILEQLKTLILEGEIKPGDKLPPERELATKLGVGRSSVRESLKVLCHMGVLTRTHEGTFVAERGEAAFKEPFTYNLLLQRITRRELLEARKVLEVALARLAAQQATDEDIAEMSEILQQAEQVVARGSASFVEIDLSFHSSIAEATQNRVLVEMFDTVRSLLYQTHRQTVRIPGVISRSHASHRKIFDAIRARDADLAAEMMAEHIEDVNRVLTEHQML